MSDKVCIIKQPAGIGDIFFCQKIAQSVRTETKYKKVIWPVASTYSYLKDYMISDGVEFVDENQEFPCKEIYNSNSLYMEQTDEYLFVPLQTSDYIQKVCKCHNNNLAHGHMKYDFCNVIKILEHILILELEMIWFQIMIIRISIWNFMMM
jgi:hypothetical protein